MNLPLNQFLLGNNVDVLKTILDNSIDLIVTSPPYGKLMKSEHYCVEYDFDGVKTELYRVLKPGGQLCWNEMDQAHDGNESGLSFRHCFAFQDYGYSLVRTIIFNKAGSPRIGDIRLINPQHEYIFELSKGFPTTVNIPKDRPNIHANRVNKSRSHRNTKGKKMVAREDITCEIGQRGDVWTYAIGGNNVYDFDERELLEDFAAPMHKGLVGDLIKAFSNPGEIVLDPFGGAGTTAKMAVKLNRNFVYIEIIPANIEIAKKRVAPFINKLDQWVK